MVNLKTEILLTGQLPTQTGLSMWVRCARIRKMEKTVNFTIMTDKSFMEHSKTTISSKEPSKKMMEPHTMVNSKMEKNMEMGSIDSRDRSNMKGSFSTTSSMAKVS